MRNGAPCSVQACAACAGAGALAVSSSQLAGLARITIEQPAYSEGADPPAEPPARGQFLDG